MAVERSVQEARRTHSGDVLFLVLRRLRAPLIALICVYAIAIAGLVMMPGAPQQLSFFHAFYVISYTATTIGFGEIPFAFSDAQRAWVTFSIYLSVSCWAYTLGSILAMMQDAAFRAALSRSRFAARVAGLEEPFFIIVGYGQSGSQLAHAIDQLDYRTVIIELRSERAARTGIQDFRNPPLVLTEDGRWPDVLRDAGVQRASCKAVVVLVGDDEVAQTVAIGTSVLSPARTVLVRAHDAVARRNLDPFPNVTVIDPFETFATNLALSLASPSVLWLEEWLTGVPGGACPKPIVVPHGHWLVMGYGRFGHAVGRALEQAGSSWTALDRDMRLADEPHLQHADNSEQSLRDAGIENAVGIIVATDRDAANLAIVSRARKLNPRLFVAIRQNHVADRALIEAARADMVFVKADIMVHECLQLLVAPQFNRFLLMVREHGKNLAEQIIVRLLTELDERVPQVWTFSCFASYPGLRQALSGRLDPPLSIADLLINPHQPPTPLRAVALLLIRDEQPVLLPAPTTTLQTGDQLLFAGARGVEHLMRHYLLDPSPIEYVRTGVEPPRSWLFRTLRARRQAA